MESSVPKAGSPLTSAPAWNEREPFAEPVQIVSSYPVLRNLMIETGIRRESAHTHRPLDRRFLADDGPLRGTADRDDVEIKRGREAPVEAQFLGTKMPPQFQGGEIQEVQGNRLFDLVCIIPCQDHPRYMGLDQLRIARVVREGRRLQQVADQLRC